MRRGGGGVQRKYGGRGWRKVREIGVGGKKMRKVVKAEEGGGGEERGGERRIREQKR